MAAHCWCCGRFAGGKGPKLTCSRCEVSWWLEEVPPPEESLTYDTFFEIEYVDHSRQDVPSPA